MTEQDYYKTPAQEVFNDIQENALKIWGGYDNSYGYATEKIDRVKGIKNYEDNAWYIVAMFDFDNQNKLLDMVKPETKEILLDVLERQQ